MPIGITNLGASTTPDFNSSSDQAIYSGSSWTPPKSGMVLCFVVNTIAAVGNVPTLAGNNIEWKNLATVAVDPGTSHRITLFGGNPTGSIAGITTASFGGQTQTSCFGIFAHVTGSIDLNNTVTGTIVQVATGNGTGVTGSVSFAAPGNENNKPIMCVFHQAQEFASQKTGWIELDDMAGVAPARGVQSSWASGSFDQNSYSTWATSAAWTAMGVELRAESGGAQIYNVSLSLGRDVSVSDSATRDLLSSLSLSERGFVSDGMTNNISPLILLSQKDGVSDGMNNNIPKDSSMNKVLTLTDSQFTGVFPVLTLLQVLATTPANFANMQGSVGLSGDLGINGDPNTSINPNASLLSRMGVSIGGGLHLLSSLSIAERLGFSVLGSIGIYPSLTLGKDLAFVPANIALIGGSVSVGQALGLIDVPRLDAQASLAFLGRMGINLSSALSATQVEAVLALAEHLGLSTAAQLNSFPLVGLGERLFLLDSNNANMFGRNVLNEVRGLNILGGISIQENVAIPIDLGILTSKLIAMFSNLTVQDRLGISDSVLANMQASVSLGETAGMGNAVSQMLNAGLSINVVGSVLTISGLNVIIVKGFVFTSETARSSVTSQDSISQSVSTTESDNTS